MNSLIINIPPRTVRPAVRRPLTFSTVSAPAGGSDDLRQLARDIVRHDPVLAMLLERSGERIRLQ